MITHQSDSQHQLEELLADIEAYFDCRLSDDEETRLRRRVADTRYSHPLISEARALMGFRRPVRRASRRPRVWPMVSAAASAIVVAALGWWMIARDTTEPPTASTCYAWVGGQRVTDEEAVMLLLDEALSEGAHRLEIEDAAVVASLGEVAPLYDNYEKSFML